MQEPEQEKCGTTHHTGCASHEQGWENKWKAAVEMAAQAIVQRDEAREAARLADLRAARAKKTVTVSLADPAIALAEAVQTAAYIGARLIMDIQPMTRLFQIIPPEDIVRFDTRQISPEQWEITMHP